MVSPSSGWAVGAVPGHYVLYRTTDSGRHWANVSPPGFARTAIYDEDTEEDEVGCALPDAQRAWVAAVGSLPGNDKYDLLHIWRTGDGGAHWRESHIRTQYVGYRLYLQFLDSRHGVLLALGGPAAGEMAKEFYRTKDGGQHWKRMTSPDSIMDSFYPTGMTFRTSNEGWISATNHGILLAPFLHTMDGGRTWHNQVFLPPTGADNLYGNTLPPLFFGHDRKSGLFIAEIRDSKVGTSLYGTHDGGRHWRRRNLLPSVDTGDAEDPDRAVNFVSARLGWATDTHSHLFVTQNGGRAWQRIARRFDPPSPTGEGDWEGTQLDFVSPRVGWALFRRRTEKTDLSDLYQTQDGGYHWRHIQAGSTPNPVYVALYGNRSTP